MGKRASQSMTKYECHTANQKLAFRTPPEVNGSRRFAQLSSTPTITASRGSRSPPLYILYSSARRPAAMLRLASTASKPSSAGRLARVVCSNCSTTRTFGHWIPIMWRTNGLWYSQEDLCVYVCSRRGYHAHCGRQGGYRTCWCALSSKSSGKFLTDILGSALIQACEAAGATIPR